RQRLRPGRNHARKPPRARERGRAAPRPALRWLPQPPLAQAAHGGGLALRSGPHGRPRAHAGFQPAPTPQRGKPAPPARLFAAKREVIRGRHRALKTSNASTADRKTTRLNSSHVKISYAVS